MGHDVERLEANGLDAARERELDALQLRMGYKFKNPDHLRVALDSYIYYDDRDQGLHYHSRLAKFGDGVLNIETTEWLNSLYAWDVSTIKELGAIIESNLYLSVVGLRLKLQRAVMANSAMALSVKADSKKRVLADVVEALIAAIHVDGGPEAARRFVRTHILTNPTRDPLMRDMFMLCSTHPEEVQKAFISLTRRRGVVRSIKFQNRYKAWVEFDGEHSGIIVEPEYSSEAQALNGAAVKFLGSNPWIMWGFEKDGSIVVPHRPGEYKRKPRTR